MENNVLAFNQSLADGELVDVSAIAADLGYEWPVGLAKAVHTAIARQAEAGVDDGVWELLFAARLQAQEAARANASATELDVSAVVGRRRGQGVLVHAHMVVGVDEASKTPCVVFLKPAFLEKE